MKFFQFAALKRIGGKHALDCIRNMLGNLVSHSLALKMNWSGRNEKSDFKKFKNIVKVMTGKNISPKLRTIIIFL